MPLRRQLDRQEPQLHLSEAESALCRFASRHFLGSDVPSLAVPRGAVNEGSFSRGVKE